MAKKFVRGITDIKTISNQDFDTNNVNDLLSDGQHNYIHRKKGNTEEYHNLTNNIKTIESSNTSLLSVTNYNNSTNSARLTPKHDRRKEQLLESTDNTILIEHGENGTDETTSVDVNPEIVLEHDNLLTGDGISKSTSGNTSTLDVNPAKVLEHENLLTGYGISKSKSGNTLTLGVEYTKVSDGYDLNNLVNGRVRTARLTHAPEENQWFFVSSWTESNFTLQEAIRLVDTGNRTYRRLKYNGVWGEWREQTADKSVIDTQLAQKQNTLTSNTSIGISGSGLRQLYTQSQTYTHANATLKTHVKSVANSTSISTLDEEFNFLAKMDKGSSSATFTLNQHDASAFASIIDSYGEDGSVNIGGGTFSLSDSTLTFNCNDASDNAYVITFSDIIEPAQSVQSSNQEQETE